MAKELFKHPEITEIDGCTRSRKYVNGIQISIEIDTLHIGKPKYFKAVLADEGISEEDFEYFKRRLRDTGLRHYFKKWNYSIFVTGGMFGDIEGILVVHENDSIPKEGIRLNDHYYISIGNVIEKDVYWISG
ncbi:MAG: hypothetical protein GY705_19320 [Bacteroidetes bacterium]|nr:hypothetical protein [Bacteroidota bacterium]